MEQVQGQNVIPAERLKKYFTGQLKSPIYDESVRIYKAMKLHANGEKPDALIGDRRPNESEEVLAYRLKIWEPITRQTFNRVAMSLGKIRRSNDWSVKYNEKATFAKITEGERLNDYCETSFPYYTSVTNWAFAVLLRQMLTDSNAAILVIPMEGITADKFSRPYPIIFNSDQVIDHIDGQYTILKACDKVDSTTTNGAKYKSDKFYVVTTTEITPFIEKNGQWIPVSDEIVVHNLGYIPVINMRGQYLRSVHNYSLFESRLASMIPSMNEAVREYSDLQAAVVSHLFPERWEIATQECHECSGIGHIPNPAYNGKDNKSKQLVCPACHGIGAKSASSPYKKTVIRPAKVNLGEQAVPIPPFDYVKKDIETIKVMDDRWEKHLFRALSSVNMQFLAQVPLSISGDAKQVDRDELNNFVYNVAEDIVYLIDKLYAVIADYRYSTLYPSVTDRRAMLPYIAVPQQIDLLGADYYAAQLAALRTSNVNGPVVRSMEMEYVSRQFYDRQDILIPAKLESMLDPMAGVSDSDKAVRKMNNGISEIGYKISCNIKDFIQRALSDVKDFDKQDPKAQRDQMVKYAQEMIDAEKSAYMPADPNVS